MALRGRSFFSNDVTTTTTPYRPYCQRPPAYGDEVYILYDGNSTTPTSTHGTYEVIVVNRPVYTNLKLVEEVIEEVKKPKYRPPPGILKEVAPPKELKSRHGFQQMCRLPCYRGVRTR